MNQRGGTQHLWQGLYRRVWAVKRHGLSAVETAERFASSM
jgi:hypothetical protein